MKLLLRTRLAVVPALVALVLGAVGATPADAVGSVFHATPSGTGDCSTWTDACSLQTALTGAATGDEIWVAAGTYKPTASTSDRAATFQLKNGVAVYGGFAGTETARTQRNPAANLTVLSGDIDNNDTQTPVITDATTVTGNTTNSYHVVTGGSAATPSTGATISGFTITAGAANGSGCSGNACGGGLYDPSGSSPTLTNITFSGNFVSGSESAVGGGMYSSPGSPTLVDVTFVGNFSSQAGGGLAFYSSAATLANVTFVHNSSNGYAGGLWNYDSSPTLTNVTFSGNSTAAYGGGMGNRNSSPTLMNVTFSGNSSSYQGGGMWGVTDSHPIIRNTIFWGNTAPSSGSQIHDFEGTTYAILSDSVVQGGYSGSNIITADPKLGALGSNGGSTQTIPLSSGSSAIDAGNDATCAAADQRGITRPQGAHCDIGAFEVQTVLLAAPGGLTGGSCGSWGSACELRHALASAVAGQEIWVAAGTYKPTASTSDRNATFQLKNGVAVYGGFVGTETARSQRDPVVNLTVLSGDIDDNDSQTPIITDIATVSNNTSNSYHVVTGVTGATLEGFTITAGNADTTGNACPGTGCGGGMYNYNSSSPTLTNIIFSGNSTYTAGGGMINHTSSSPVLTNVTFSSNSQTYAWGSNGGGGMYDVFSSSPTLTNVTFSQNTAYWGGGLFSQHSSSPTLTNVTFSQNSASIGGGMFTLGSNPVMRNVTFDGNSAVSRGGGLNIDSGSAQILNSIFWGNAAPSGGQVYIVSGGSATSSDSVVQDGCPAGSTCTNIITADPKLGALGNYGGFTRTVPLLAGSSAIDAGDNATCAITDQRGMTRPQGDNCDIGAFEATPFPVAIIAVPTLTGTATVAVDWTGTSDPGGSGVAAYLLSESGSTPAIDHPAWQLSAPATFALSADDGPKTVYAWVKDNNGSISSRFSASTVLDTTAPTVSLSVPALLATPDVALTLGGDGTGSAIAGWFVSEIGTAPGSGDPGWQPTKPATFTLPAGEGSRTLYAWTKDAAGHVSARATATTLLDTTAPTASLTAPATSPTLAITITVGGSDGTVGSGIAAWAVVEGTAAPATGSAAWVAAAPRTFTLSAGNGGKTVSAFTRDAAGNVSDPATKSVTLAITAPTAAIVLPPLTPSASVAVDWTGTAAGTSAIVGYLLSADPSAPGLGDSRWATSAPATFTFTSGDGIRTVHAWVKDAADSISASADASTVLDTTAPSGGGAPTVALATTSAVSTTVPVTVSWPGTTDALTGPAIYEFETSSDGGANWTPQTLANPATANATLSLAPATWRFHVRAADRAGNRTAWFAGTVATTVSLTQENAAALKYKGAFSRAKLGGSSGGYVKYASAKGRTVTFVATGRTFAFVSTLAKARGKAEIWLDGRKVKVLDMYATTTRAGAIAWSKTFVTPGKHTLKIVVTGAKSPRATGKRVDIDAFTVLR
jgi:hypothetical protein